MLDSLLKDFKNPGSTFRGAPFWAWNAELEPEKLREQIRTMKDDFRKEMGKLGGKRFHGPKHGFRGECGPRPFHGEHGWHNDCAPRCPRGEGWHDGPRRHPGPRHGGCEMMR